MWRYFRALSIESTNCILDWRAPVVLCVFETRIPLLSVSVHTEAHRESDLGLVEALPIFCDDLPGLLGDRPPNGVSLDVACAFGAPSARGVPVQRSLIGKVSIDDVTTIHGEVFVTSSATR